MTLRRLVALMVLVGFLLAACSGADRQLESTPTSIPAASAPTTQAQPESFAGTIIFDTAHGEIFAPGDTSELGQSEVVAKMRQSGYEVRVNEATIDESTLDGVAALYVPGPMRNFSADNSGSLTVTLNAVAP